MLARRVAVEGALGTRTGPPVYDEARIGAHHWAATELIPSSRSGHSHIDPGSGVADRTMTRRPG